ncbi:MAG: sensor histidine kinase [Acidimicrobiales bacterium]
MGDKGELLSGKMLRASPLSIGVAVVIAAVTVAGFAFTKRSADQQDSVLLESNTKQAALYAASAFSGIGSTLDTLATAVALTDGSPSVFAARAKLLAQGHKLLAQGQLALVLAHQVPLVLAHQVHGAYVADSALGPGFTAGQVLPAPVSATMAEATTELTPAPVVFDGRTSTVGFAVGPPLVPAGMAVYLQFALNPFLPSPATSAKPFASLKVAMYGSATADPAHLLVATSHDLPLQGQTATAHATVGSATWTLVGAARWPLTGGFANSAPYIILALGLFVAFLVGATVESLERRQRYAAQLVAERTGDLNRSLSELRQAQGTLVRGERLTALGEMASVVGHELRNPLAAVTNSLYLLRRVLGEPAGEEYEKHLAMAERETGKAAALAEDLTAFVRPRVPQKSDVELADVVHEVVEATPPPSHVALTVEVEALNVHADRRQLAEVLTNLVTNAYQAVPDGGTVHISGHRNGAGTVLSVQDSGPGVDAELADRIFEPFFTTKHDGTGLGLAIVRRLIEAHGGQVAFEDRGAAGGARVVLRLPADGTEVVS